MSGFIDFHTHAFPDNLAATAIPYLEKEGNIKAFLDGTVGSLLASMDRSGIEKSVIGSIATKPSQFESILSWSRKIAGSRIIPFPSFHPAAPDRLEQIARIRAAGFKGIKMHPYYQNFYLDEERMYPVYEKIREQDLILLMHTGFDIAFPRTRMCSPDLIVKVVTDFPGLKLVTTHLGAWEQWDEVRQILAGRPVYMDISYTLDQVDSELARDIILHHPKEYILFGSDSPWSDQQATEELLRGLRLGEEREQLILRENGLRLLNSVDP